jgi:hypothetical protein
MAQYTFDAPFRGYKFRITLTDSNVNTGNNTSTVDWVIEHYQANYEYSGTMNRFLTIDGQTVYSFNNNYDTTPYAFYTWWTVASGTTSAITHNQDGTKSVSVQFYWSGLSGGFGPGTVDQTWTFTLVTINRYAAFTSLTYTPITDVGFTINATVDNTCDLFEYSLNNGSSYTALSGDFTTKTVVLSDLPSDTTYQVISRVRRKDSQLKTTSGMTSVTTATQNNFMGFM